MNWQSRSRVAGHLSTILLGVSIGYGLVVYNDRWVWFVAGMFMMQLIHAALGWYLFDYIDRKKKKQYPISNNTVRTLEECGSWESARIAKDYLKRRRGSASSEILEDVEAEQEHAPQG